MKNYKISIYMSHSSFSIVIDVILNAQWKIVVIATSSLLLVLYVNVLFFFENNMHKKAITMP